jgi:hypothetical protein
LFEVPEPPDATFAVTVLAGVAVSVVVGAVVVVANAVSDGVAIGESPRFERAGARWPST